MDRQTRADLDDLFVKLIDRKLVFGDFEHLLQAIETIVKDAIKPFQWKLDNKEKEIKKLTRMIDLGLGWEDMRNDL